MLCSAYGSRRPKNMSTPAAWKIGRPERLESQRHSSRESQAIRV
jgi:hypothetical protein